ncbi:MAG: DUF1002 domain-containing protein [Clostridia bacterium]|nr:DUF1002 domain-containing protein [Clostridia bacterium]
MKRVLALVLLIFIAVQSFAYAQQSDTIVTFGADIKESDKQQMLQLFGVQPDEVKTIEVTIDEARKQLEGIASREVIGTKAISCAYIEKKEEGYGLDIETHNVTHVTSDMYRNALVTAGVKDAKVVVAAPFNVSGTTALTGIMKGFEDITGEDIQLDNKKLAGEEILQTVELSKKIGPDKASELIKIVKEKVADKDVKDEQDIREIVKQVAKEIGVELSEQDIENIVQFIKKMISLIPDLRENLSSEEARNIFRVIADAIGNLFKWIASLF